MSRDVKQALKGISTGEMSDALVHLGFDGSCLSPASVTRMTEVWQGEYDDWNKRDLTGKHYVYTSEPTASTSAAGLPTTGRACWF